MINRVGDFIECIDHAEKGDGNANSARIIARRFAQGQRGQREDTDLQDFQDSERMDQRFHRWANQNRTRIGRI
jgi:hypothetical protein